MLFILVNFVYPVYYREYVDKYSEIFGVDRELVFGVIRTESRFDKKAVSSPGAKGLMQIMDDTGEEIFNKLNVSAEYRDLYDPEANIMVGIYYLSELDTVYNGDEDKVLAAYNSGMTNVDRWEKSGEDFVDSIDYRETREYIKRVTRSKKIYHLLYSVFRLGFLSLPTLFVDLKIILVKIIKGVRSVIS